MNFELIPPSTLYPHFSITSAVDPTSPLPFIAINIPVPHHPLHLSYINSRISFYKSLPSSSSLSPSHSLLPPSSSLLLPSSFTLFFQVTPLPPPFSLFPLPSSCLSSSLPPPSSTLPSSLLPPSSESFWRLLQNVYLGYSNLMEKNRESCLDLGLHTLFLNQRKELIIIDLGLMTFFGDNNNIVDCPPPEILTRAKEEARIGGGGGGKEGGRQTDGGGGGREGGGWRREEEEVWRMGVLFFEMLTGRKPWRSKSEEGYLNAIETIGVKLGENIEAGLRELIGKMLRKDIQFRIKWNEIAKYLKLPEERKKEDEGGWKRQLEEGKSREIEGKKGVVGNSVESEGNRDRSEIKKNLRRNEMEEEGREGGGGKGEEGDWKISIFSMFCQEGSSSANRSKPSLLKYPSLELDAKKGVNTKEFGLEAGEANQMNELQKILMNYKEIEGVRKSPFSEGKSSDFFNLKENFGRSQIIIKSKEGLLFENKCKNEAEGKFGDQKMSIREKQERLKDSKRKELDSKAFSNPFEKIKSEDVSFEANASRIHSFEAKLKEDVPFQSKSKQIIPSETKPKEAISFESKHKQANLSQIKPNNLAESQKYPDLSELAYPSIKNEKINLHEPKKRNEIQLEEKKEDNLKKIKVSSCFQGKMANFQNISEEMEEKNLNENVNSVLQARQVNESKLVDNTFKKESQIHQPPSITPDFLSYIEEKLTKLNLYGRTLGEAEVLLKGSDSFELWRILSFFILKRFLQLRMQFERECEESFRDMHEEKYEAFLKTLKSDNKRLKFTLTPIHAEVVLKLKLFKKGDISHIEGFINLDLNQNFKHLFFVYLYLHVKNLDIKLALIKSKSNYLPFLKHQTQVLELLIISELDIEEVSWKQLERVLGEKENEGELREYVKERREMVDLLRCRYNI